MATYIIGDLQGCWRTLRALLGAIRYDEAHDQLYCLGDLVNRGPDSLSILRWAQARKVHCVLGNHDLYALAIHAGVAARKSDTLDALMEAPDRDALFDWLRRQPLMRIHGQYAMVHAAYAPAWHEHDAMGWADEIHAALTGQNWHTFLGASMDPASRESDPRQRALAIMTRGRYFTHSGAPNFEYKGPPETAPSQLSPWYTFGSDTHRPRTVLFGHWASLKHRVLDGAVSLDGGAVWGGTLAALRVEDGKVFQQPAVAEDVYAAL
ncbi:MAG: symmetrical bis(5'-nucleosyl)-tetraphosphatase [Myxococcota bacterium]|nr:symmetrical bis(5'-nucleosyl)-tetraphosphatase [Myxococcota bacterium]